MVGQWTHVELVVEKIQSILVTCEQYTKNKRSTESFEAKNYASFLVLFCCFAHYLLNGPTPAP